MNSETFRDAKPSRGSEPSGVLIMNGWEVEKKVMRFHRGRLRTLFETKMGGSIPIGTGGFQRNFSEKGYIQWVG